jgi:hypothetical protein
MNLAPERVLGNPGTPENPKLVILKHQGRSHSDEKNNVHKPSLFTQESSVYSQHTGVETATALVTSLQHTVESRSMLKRP